MLNGKVYSHNLIAAESLNFVKEHRDEPFFLYLAFTIPHAKLQVPDLAPYEAESWPQNLKTVAAMITRMDRDVGRLVDLLEELQIDKDSLVIFASDNGAAYRDKVFDHSGPLRGAKRDMYEGGLRSPSIASWPGRIKAGAVSEQVWAFWDFLPMMAELTGQKPPADSDGISVLPALLDGKAVEHPPLYFEFHERGFSQAARIGDWKAVRLGTRKPIELFNIKADLEEAHDVATANPEVVREFEDYLKAARFDSEIWPINENVSRGKTPAEE
jgi:arylsulfatase A-like enzyme